MLIYIYFEKDVTPSKYVACQLSFPDSYFVLFIAAKKPITYIPDTLHMLPHCQLNHPAEIPDESATKGPVTGSSYM